MAGSVIDPECREGKHAACPGYTWREGADGTIWKVLCGCHCHDD